MSHSDSVDNHKGFPAGTLVHTDKGLVPIQDIKVGDMVLSMPEEGVGEKAYKRVLKTFKTANQEVYRCTYWARDQYDEDEPHISYVLATANYPIWSITEGKWLPARWIETADEVYILDKGKPYHFLYANQIHRTQDEQGNIYGYCHSVFSEDGDIESYFEMSDNSVIIYLNKYGEIFYPNNKKTLDISIKIDLSSRAEGDRLLCDVYNLEVEDFHTYFVGEQGLWIHT